MYITNVGGRAGYVDRVEHCGFGGYFGDCIVHVEKVSLGLCIITAFHLEFAWK